ncbi:MAG: pilus assembly protein TadG-related protein [Candidatus Dormibacteria bacterium]
MKSVRQRGQILPIFCLLLALLLLPVTGLAVDGGLLMSSHATLVGVAQAAAEAAAQAVDVTAIQSDDVFQLCATPDGGPTCGNGVGTVGDVVGQVIRASYPTVPSRCIDESGSPLSSVADQSAGCAFAMRSNCGSVALASAAGGTIPDGVAVLTWRTVELPLSVFPGWTSVRLSASAVAWMEHGYGRTATDSGVGGNSC